MLYEVLLSKTEGRDTVYSYDTLKGMLYTPNMTAGWPYCDGIVGLRTDMTKNGYRLPTEAEWEYACRGGTTTRYWWGNDIAGSQEREWTSENSHYVTHPVKTRLPNPFGLYDMQGNVTEWCYDWYALYTVAPQVNPVGPLTGTGRVHRGNEWCSAIMGGSHSTNRGSLPPEISSTNGKSYIGLRVAITLP